MTKRHHKIGFLLNLSVFSILMLSVFVSILFIGNSTDLRSRASEPTNVTELTTETSAVSESGTSRQRLLPAIAGATVRSRQPDAIAGASESLAISNNPTAISLLRFSLPDIDTPNIVAILRIYNSGNNTDSFRIRVAEGVSWTPDDVTYTTRPIPERLLMTTRLDRQGWQEIDVTKAIIQRTQDDLTFVFDKAGDTTLQISSPTSDKPPVLILRPPNSAE